MRNLVFGALVAVGLLTSSGCCQSAFRICDGPCGGGNDPCTWYPGKCLFDKVGCNSGCGKYYWSDWHSEPPACCDPCDRCGGGYAGQYYDCNSCGCGSGGWGNEVGGYAGGPVGGGGCGCSGGGGGMGGAMMPAAEGDVIYETGAMRSRKSPTPMTPTPVEGPTRGTANRPKAPQASIPRVRYNNTMNTARQQQPQRRVRPATHVTSNTSWEESEEVRQATTAPAEKPCTTCRR